MGVGGLKSQGVSFTSVPGAFCPLELEEGEGLPSCWVEPEGSRPGLKESVGPQGHAGSEAALLQLEQ